MVELSTTKKGDFPSKPRDYSGLFDIFWTSPVENVSLYLELKICPER